MFYAPVDIRYLRLITEAYSLTQAFASYSRNGDSYSSAQRTTRYFANKAAESSYALLSAAVSASLRRPNYYRCHLKQLL